MNGGGAVSVPATIAITVLGGYLGAGKTTVLNRLLADPGDRRIGVIVNDFGALAIDVELLGGPDRDGVVSLPNGCVCCTLGTDLYDALRALAARADPPDHIVIEASGVADPAVAAAWGTSAGFEPGGVIVLAAADAVRRQSSDRYVGGEVLRQLAGADLIVVTKPDLCDDLDALHRWLGELSPDVPRTSAVDGELPVDLVLGLRPDAPPAGTPAETQAGTPIGHTDRYVTWSWSGGPLEPSALNALLENLPDGLLRMKGVVELTEGAPIVVQVVGRTVHTARHGAVASGTKIVAIGSRDEFDVARLDRRFG